MSSLKTLEQDWQELGIIDPFYAVLSHADKKFGQWDERAFFTTGESEIASLMKRAGDLTYPKERGTALDFGCGVGRLTRALSAFFSTVDGVDISASMVEQAKRLHHHLPSCRFIQNTEPNLSLFPSDHFDLIYSSIVLQHVSDPDAVKSYLAEFVRTLKPNGLAAFHLPIHLPIRAQWQPQQRLFHVLRAMGISAEKLYRWHLLPISMHAMEERSVRDVIAQAGGRLIAVDANTFSGPTIESRMFFVTKDPVAGSFTNTITRSR